MKTKIEIDLKPFKTPNFVLVNEKVGERQDGVGEVRSFPLSELDSDTLEQLCEDFTNEIFKKTKKQRPERAYLAK